MKHIVNSSQVAHLWAHKTQDSARNGSHSVFFEGSTIYSYGSHFPIARHVHYKGKDCVFFTTRDYSVTTSGHKSTVRRAIPHNIPVFNVCLSSVIDETKHRKERQAEYENRVKSCLATLSKKRISRSLEWEFNGFQKLLTEANSFCEFFGLKKRFNPDLTAIELKIKRFEEGCTVCHSLPDEPHDAKKHKNYENRDRIAEQRRERQRQAIEAKYQEWKTEQADKLERWKNGEQVYLSSFNSGLSRRQRTRLGVTDAQTTDFQYMRIRGENIETTLNATVPVSHCVRAWRLIKVLLERGETYKRNGHSIHLGDYVIDSLDENGVLTVGCHRFERVELERIGAVLEQTERLQHCTHPEQQSCDCDWCRVLAERGKQCES